MAKILTPEEFRKMPEGTVFAFGAGPHCIGPMLILDCIIGPFDGGDWGFYAINPIGIDANDFEDAEAKVAAGGDIPIETSSTKYMSYDGDDMSCFFVLSAVDWAAISGMARFE